MWFGVTPLPDFVVHSRVDACHDIRAEAIFTNRVKEAYTEPCLVAERV